MLYKVIRTNIVYSLILILFLIHNSEPTNAGGVKVSDSWARESIVAGRPGIVYLTITNHTLSPITLIGADTMISKKVQIHETYKENNITKMRPIDKVTIASGARFKFQPGGYHFMLVSLNQSLRPTDIFPLVLYFADSEKHSVNVHVVKNAGNSIKKRSDHHEH